MRKFAHKLTRIYGLFQQTFREKKETLDKGLERTKQGVWSKITRAIAGHSTIDDDFLDELEEVFITSDVGVETTLKIIERIRARVARDKFVGTDELHRMLREEIALLLAENDKNQDSAPTEDFHLPKGTLTAIRNYGGGSQRCRQDHHYRQTRIPVQTGRQQSDARSGRHISMRLPSNSSTSGAKEPEYLWSSSNSDQIPHQWL